MSTLELNLVSTIGGRPARVVVVGAGLAGLCVARELSSKGYCVHLIERRRVAGGDLLAVETPLGRADHSLHLLLGTCTSTIELVQQLGQGAFLHTLPVAYQLVGTSDVARLDLPPTGVSGCMGSALSFSRGTLPTGGGKLRALRDLWSLLRSKPEARESAAEYLARAAIHADTVAFLSEWTLGVFNAPPKHVHAGLWRSSLFQMFASPGAPRSILATSLLEELITLPLLRSLEVAGAHVHTRRRVQEVVVQSGQVRGVVCQDEFLGADLVVWAAAPEELHGMACWQSQGRLPAAGSRSRGYHIANVLVEWNDKPLGTPFVFDSGPDSGPPGWQAQNRLTGFRNSPLQWIFPAGPGRAILAGSALSHEDLPRLSAAVAECMRRLALPAPRHLHTIIRRHATWRQDADFELSRAPSLSHIKGLLLAGAWCDVGVPLSMEAAVRSARQAADALFSLKPEAGGGVTDRLFL